MRERFEGQDQEFGDVPKRGGETFVRLVPDQIQRQQDSVPRRQPSPSEPLRADPEALRLLQRRLAAGEISADQYEELLRSMNR